MTWTLLLRFWKPLVSVAVLLLAWLALHHFGATRFSQGYQQATSENAKALADWKLKYDAQVKADDARINAANIAHEKELGLLAALRVQPVNRVVCHASDPRHVPAIAGLQRSENPGSGALPSAPTESAPAEFDPTDELFALADEADYLAASCRRLHQEVHGMPSSK